MYFMFLKLITMIVVICIHEYICGSIMSSGQLRWCVIYLFFVLLFFLKYMYPDQLGIVLFKYICLPVD